MIDVLKQLLPLFLGFFLAITAKRFKILDQKDGQTLLKVAFYITIPPLVLLAASNLKLNLRLYLFLLLPIILALATYGLSRFLTRGLELKKSTRGVVVAAPMAVNSAFSLAFLVGAFGPTASVRVALFNAINSPILFIGVYAIAATHNPELSGRKQVIKNIIGVPALWALAAGLLLNILHINTPDTVKSALQSIANLTSLTVIIALGLVFAPRKAHLGLASAITLLRVGVGLVVGTSLVLLLHLKGIDASSVLLLAAAPVGTNMLTFSTVQRLDYELTASAVSYSLLICLLIAPVVIWLFT